MEPRFHERSLPTGARLHVAEWGPDDGEPVLLLHGVSDSWQSWRPLVPLLPAHWRLVAPDQRGHGRSRGSTEGVSMASLAADAAALVDGLGLPAVTVVGHSMGGFVAQELALARPDRVARLALLATGAAGDCEAVRALAGEVAALRDPVPRAFIQSFQEGTAHVPLDPAFLATVVEESLRLSARTWHALASAILAFDVRSRLARVAAPTQVVWGDRDGIFGRGETETLRAAIAGAGLSILPETGHALHWERPEPVAAALVALVESADRRAPVRAGG